MRRILGGGPHERRLLEDLFIKQKHNPLERPAQNDSETVSVEIKFTIVNLIDCVSEIEILFSLNLCFLKFV